MVSHQGGLILRRVRIFASELVASFHEAYCDHEGADGAPGDDRGDSNGNHEPPPAERANLVAHLLLSDRQGRC